MARRKNNYLTDSEDSDASDEAPTDGDYNSQEDEDSKAERALFEHNGRKRRRRGEGRSGKEAAWEGVFGEDQSSGIGAGRNKGSRLKNSRTDWTKCVQVDVAHFRPPSFVSDAQTKRIEKSEDVEDSAEPGNSADTNRDSTEEVSGSDSESESSASASKPPSPRRREEEEDEEDAQPRGGLGGASQASRGGIGSSRGGIGASRGGVGSSRGVVGSGRGGIGSSRGGLGARPPPQAQEQGAEIPPEEAAMAPRQGSEGPSRPQQSFKGRQKTSGTATPTELTAKEAAHFRTIGSTFGARMLANLGWAPGKGLGVNEDGRAVPVAAGKILRGQGIAKGVRTEDSKREARRRGEIVSDDEEAGPSRRPRGSAPKARNEANDGWKRHRKVKVKVEHKTYEQLVAEAGDRESGVGLVIDARGGELREVSSLSELSLSPWTPLGEGMQLPELRHNLRLVVDSIKSDVDALAKEGRNVNERRRWTLRDELKGKQKLEKSGSNASRLQQVMDLCAVMGKETSLSALHEQYAALKQAFSTEYTALALDELLVGMIGQMMKQDFAQWEPFLESDTLPVTLSPWKDAFRLADQGSDREMTAWESFLWTHWVPKVRSAINNNWSASDPQPVIDLMEKWQPVLPAFIRDNILDQLILPKIKTTVDAWDSRKSKGGKKSLASIVFPWLPLLGDRMGEVLEMAKRRLKNMLRSWVPSDGIPSELVRWRTDIYTSSEWDKLALQHIVPKLGACLRDDFVINPRNQELKALEWVLPWHSLLRSSVFTHLLEVGFFPKWLDILYIWLIQPGFKADEVATWFTWWKDRFPSSIQEMPGVKGGFKQGLELMQQAMTLGTNASTQLQKPTFRTQPSKVEKKTKSRPRAEVDTGITFRQLVEDYALQNDLIFLSLGRSHAATGKPLFKVAKTLESRGITVYIGDSAVFAQNDDNTFRAVSLEEMARRAST